MEAALRSGLKPAAAKATVCEVHAAAADWRKTAKKLRIPARTLSGYASTFEHPLMDEDAKLGV